MSVENLPEGLFALELIIVIFTGLVFGSFASALIYRIPRDIPWFYHPANDENKKAQACRSACPHCGYTLRVRDLIPIFSWLFLRGQCRQCGARISPMYPLAEMAVLGGFLSVYFGFGLDWTYLALYLLVPVLVALLFIDVEHYILPDGLVLSAGILAALHWGLLWSQSLVSKDDILSLYIAGVLIFGFFAWILGLIVSRLLKKDALGFGDVKFFAVAGLWLGVLKLSYFAILSGFLGVLLGAIWKMAGKGEVFPFGPALIIALFVLLFI